MDGILSGLSLFSGAGGLDLGLERVGIRFKAWVEYDRWAQETLNANFEIPSGQLFGDVTNVDPNRLLAAAGLAPGEAFVVAGGPPCQSFSTAGLRQSISDPRGRVVHNYLAVLRSARPRFFVFENVRGLLSAAIRHRPLTLRARTAAPLHGDEKLGSVLNEIVLPSFRGLGYEVVYGVIDAADFGIPQHRERVLIIGSRDREFHSDEFAALMGRAMTMSDLLLPTHGLGRKPHLTLRDACEDLASSDHEYQPYSIARAKIYSLIPPGCNWRYIRDNPSEFPPGFLESVMGGALNATGGRVGFWRRLSWKQPSPTLTTSPIQKATGLCHPDHLRPLSVQEYKRLQDFPDDFNICGPLMARYRQIGNAVPVGLGSAIGRSLIKAAGYRPISEVTRELSSLAV